MQRQKWIKFFALVFSFALIAAACGGSDGEVDTSSEGDGGTATAEEEEDVKGGVSEDDAKEAFSGTDTTEAMANDDTEDDSEAAMTDPESIEDLEKAWTANRDAIVADLTAKVESGEYGLGDDGILRGAGGFEIDTNTCPGDWTNTGGVTDSEIRIGHTTANSGNLAAYGNIAKGMDVYFNYVNENGGVDGRDITLLVKDDGYIAAQTIEFVNELIEAENVFEIITLGSPNTMATYSKINENCIPQPFVMTGHQAWGDPIDHPWTTGLQLSYATEAIMWGEWIRANLADKLPVKVAGLVMDNDFGLAYEKGMESYAEKNTDVISEFVPVRHDPAAPTVTNEMTTIAAEDPAVFISMTAGNPCLLGIQEADNVGLLETVDAAFMPSVCKAVSDFMEPAGDASEGWYIIGGGAKDMTDQAYDDDLYIQFMRDEISDAGLDAGISAYGNGFGLFAYPTVEALRIAAELPGGLTRTNMILAVRHISLDHPQMLSGIAFAADGANDAYMVEGTDIARFDVAKQSWIQQGPVVDLNGSSPNCSWDILGGTGCQ